MADKGMTFSEMEQRLFGAVAAGVPERDFIDDTIDCDFLFGKRYGGSSKKLEDCAKELGKLIGPSPDKQDAVASTCFVLDSLSALEKHK